MTFGLLPLTVGIAQSVPAVRSVTPPLPARSISVRDCIEQTITMADDYRYPTSVYGSGRLALFAADRSKFIIVLARGNVEKNTTDYIMLLFQTNDVFRSPAPDTLLAMSSSTNREAIKDVTWLADNERVAFLGEQLGESRQVYVFDIRSRALERRTAETGDILSYSITPSGNQVAYVVEAPVESLFDQRTHQDGLIVSGQRITDLLHATRGGLYGNATLWFQSDSTTRRQMRITDRISEWATQRPYLSPDGRYVVMALQAADIPPSWRSYVDPWLHLAAMEKLAPDGIRGYSFLRRYVLVNTIDGSSRILLNTPLDNGRPPEVAWLPDSRSVVLGDVYLPLDGMSDSERKLRQSTTFSVEVSVPAGEIATVTHEKLDLIDWSVNQRTLRYEPVNENGASTNAAVMFRKRRGSWVKETHSSTEVKRVVVVQKEAPNTPPAIYAVDRVSGHEARLFELNPQFRAMRFGKVEATMWRATDGRTVRGGLYYPPDYDSTRRYPLVLQTHGWAPNKFAMCGPYPTGFAAQPLAGKGIMVLQIDEDANYGYVNTPKEAPGETAAFEGAVDFLDRRGLIDRNRVGIIGFSRTGFHLKYALTRSRYHFAAAAYTDSFDGAYPTYLLTGALPGGDFEKVNGGPPIGDTLQSWLARDPSFNIAKVETPLRIVAENPEAALFDYPWYAMSRRLGKPVEMVMLEDGEHYLRKPWERVIDSQGNVDWFCFWLKGEEDTDPSKAERYARWHQLRAVRNSSVSDPHLH